MHYLQALLDIVLAKNYSLSSETTQLRQESTCSFVSQRFMSNRPHSQQALKKVFVGQTCSDFQSCSHKTQIKPLPAALWMTSTKANT